MRKKKHAVAAAKKRMHMRYAASGVVSFMAHWGPYGEPAAAGPGGGVWQLPQFCSKVYSWGDLIDAGYSGARLKTTLPLESGYLVEVGQQEHKLATVRWVSRKKEHYYIGLMYI